LLLLRLLLLLLVFELLDHRVEQHRQGDIFATIYTRLRPYVEVAKDRFAGGLLLVKRTDDHAEKRIPVFLILPLVKSLVLNVGDRRVGLECRVGVVPAYDAHVLLSDDLDNLIRAHSIHLDVRRAVVLDVRRRAARECGLHVDHLVLLVEASTEEADDFDLGKVGMQVTHEGHLRVHHHRVRL
jgi:hypothetical protein